MTITPERNLTVNFTAPYAHSSLGVMANKELAEGLTWPDDYNSSDVTFVCRRGATPCTYISENFPKATLRQFDDQAQTTQEVLNGNAHVDISSQPRPAFTIYDNPDVLFAPTDEGIDPGNEAFAVRKGRPRRAQLLLQLDPDQGRLAAGTPRLLVRRPPLGRPGRRVTWSQHGL